MRWRVSGASMKWFKKLFPPSEGERINTITIKRDDIIKIQINDTVGDESFINDDIRIDVDVIKNTAKFEHPNFLYDQYIYDVSLPFNPLDDIAKKSLSEIKELDRILYDKNTHMAEVTELPTVEPYVLTIFERSGTTHTFTDGTTKIRVNGNVVVIPFWDKYRLKMRGINNGIRYSAL